MDFEWEYADERYKDFPVRSTSWRGLQTRFENQLNDGLVGDVTGFVYVDRAINSIPFAIYNTIKISCDYLIFNFVFIYALVIYFYYKCVSTNI